MPARKLLVKLFTSGGKPPEIEWKSVKVEHLEFLSDGDLSVPGQVSGTEAKLISIECLKLKEPQVIETREFPKIGYALLIYMSKLATKNLFWAIADFQQKFFELK